MTPHVRWVRGGQARVSGVAADAISLVSTTPSPPGSRVEGTLEGEPAPRIRVKVRSSRRLDEGGFVIEGRLLDATREIRERLERLASR